MTSGVSGVSGVAATCYLVARSGPGGLEPLGTAFALGGRRVATALHVVGVGAQELQLIFARGDFQGYQDTNGNQVNFTTAKVVEADPVHDLAILELAQNVDVTVPWTLGSTDDVSPGDWLVSLGFPHTDSGRVVLTRQDATVGAKVLLENQGQKNKHIVINALLRPGQSGGPVMKGDGRVVAVMVGAYAPGGGGFISIGGVDPAALHQTSHAISAEYISEML